PTTHLSPLSLHDALPILLRCIPSPSAMIVSIRFAESGSKAAPMRIYGVTLCTGVADSVSGSFTAAESAGSKRPQTERAFIACPRSEEHTSELQSRGHLVC